MYIYINFLNFIYVYIHTYIYVACGEHPAAGGLYMFFCALGLYPMRSCLVVLVGTYGCLCGTLRGLVVSLWHFGWPWGSIVAPWVPILTHMGCSWKSFAHCGRPWASSRNPGAPFGYPWGPWWCLVGTFGCGPGPLVPLLWKTLQKDTQNGRPN